ncbi:hypothetical protein CLV62_10317 [Dysgonomonas alginatilytica]|uniref:Uncharacterized protein n=1 Tax=Dysgonomonas alginatilytica TaxID=1605892 RepID=A0A2V3PUG7_9BACT|nr:hypothetical protein CLV62_10317 [Dysgonomonas alginatilytica]
MDRVRELNYNKRRINNELFTTYQEVIKELVLRIVHKTRKYPIKYIKMILKVIYLKLDIDKKAKSTDLNLLFQTSPCYINKNGKIVRGIIIW